MELAGEDWVVPRQTLIALLKTRCSDTLWSRVVRLLETDKVLWKGLNLDIAWEYLELAQTIKTIAEDNSRKRRGTTKKKESKKDEGAKAESENSTATPKPPRPRKKTTQEPP